MKKIITLFAAIVLMPGMSEAQRQVNLELTMKDLVNNLSFLETAPFYWNATVKNLGPDTLRSSDTVLAQVLVDNVPMVFVVNGIPDSFYLRQNGPIAPNDSFVITSQATYFTYNGTYTYCTEVSLGQNITDLVADPDITNNRRCALIHIILLSVSSLTKEDRLKVFPIPANKSVSWSVEDMNGQKHVSLYDVNGKLVYNEITEKQAGQMDLSNLSRGIYFLQVKDNESKRIWRKVVKG